MIGLINYGSGNIHAIANIYKRLDIPYSIMSEPSEFKTADKLILPGVGDFDETMKFLVSSGMKDTLDELVLVKKKLIAGVCVGMQILGNRSEEGDLDGFGWIKGSIKKLDPTKLSHKPHLPHLGWNSITPKRETSLFNNIDTEKGFYFLHTYYFDCDDAADILVTTQYGIEFPSAINHENVFGFQFHPEKSHFNGIELFKNYANL
jgi:imidazole glycerol-phosphate synthase subunit HisH